MMSSPHILPIVRPAGARPDTADKHFATLQARCALAGAVLERWRDEAGRPTYSLTRGAVCISLASAGAVEAWLVADTREGAATWS